MPVLVYQAGGFPPRQPAAGAVTPPVVQVQQQEAMQAPRRIPDVAYGAPGLPPVVTVPFFVVQQADQRPPMRILLHSDAFVVERWAAIATPRQFAVQPDLLQRRASLIETQQGIPPQQVPYVPPSGILFRRTLGKPRIGSRTSRENESTL